jgi:hypothetical protein
MTNTTELMAAEPLLKTDVLGRVRTPVERREMLLDEFEKSGLSGKKFAAMTGVSYQPEFAKPNDEANLAHQLVLLEEPPS